MSISFTSSLLLSFALIVCFGTVETIIHGITQKGKYYFEYDIIEPEIFAETIFQIIEKSRIIEAISHEIELCKKHEKQDMAEVLKKRK